MLHDTQTETYCEGRPAQGGLIPLGIPLKLGKFYSFTCILGRTAFAVEKAFYTMRTILGSMRDIQILFIDDCKMLAFHAVLGGALTKSNPDMQGARKTSTALHSLSLDGPPVLFTFSQQFTKHTVVVGELQQ